MRIRASFIAIVALGCAMSAAAQIQVGDMTHISLTGTVGAGYSGGYTDSAFSSSHGVGVNGDAYLVGDYFNPRFLNFNVHPYYGRSQDTSTSVSIGESSGLGSNVNLFSGSPFPGSISYSATRNSTGQFALPGSSSLVSQGNSSSIGVTWSENLANLPHVSVGFVHEGATSRIVGTDGTDLMNSNSFNVSSSYQLGAWPLNMSYFRTASSSEVPATLTGLGTSEEAKSSSLQVGTFRTLGRGGMSMNYTRSNTDYNYKMDGDTTGGSTKSNAFNANMNYSLPHNFTTGAQFTYDDNLLGSTIQQLVNSGAVVADSGPLRSLLFSGSLSWSGMRGFVITGGAMHQRQYFDGTEYDNTSAYGNLNYNYNHPLFGSLYFTFGFNDSATKDGNTGMGFYSNVSFSRKIHRWNVTASYGYSQNVQTMASFVTSSGMSYGVSVSRKFGGYNWHASAGGGHSGFSSLPASNHSERISTGLSRRGYSCNVFYGQGSSYALLTPTGVVTTGVPNSLLVANSTYFTTDNYGVSATATFFRHIMLVAAYTKSSGNSQLSSSNQISNASTVENALLRIPYRKLFFTAGYNRIEQGVTTPGTPLHPVTSYNFGIYRWLKVF